MEDVVKRLAIAKTMKSESPEEKGERLALASGRHRLMGAVLQLPPCGCTVEGAGNLLSPIKIVYCKAHKAVKAPKRG